MARIVVTGATGLLGSTLVPVLSRFHRDVVGLSRSGRAAPGVDLTDAVATARALDALTPDVIVNLAAATNVDQCERDPRLAYSANTLIVENIVRWIGARHSQCHLVQISTDQVYDGSGPHSEERVCPINYYGYSKYAGELLAHKVGSTVLRTNLFGRSLRPERATLSDWLVAAMRRGEPIKVFEDILFNPLSLESLSSMVAVAIERRVFGTFNLGSRAGMSKADFAFELAQTLGLSTANLTRAASDELGLAARRPKDMRMDAGRFESSCAVALPTLQAEIELMRGAYANET